MRKQSPWMKWDDYFSLYRLTVGRGGWCVCTSWFQQYFTIPRDVTLVRLLLVEKPTKLSVRVRLHDQRAYMSDGSNWYITKRMWAILVKYPSVVYVEVEYK